MHDPPIPGEFIIQVYLEPNNLSSPELAGKLGVAAAKLNRILTGASPIGLEMALRLSEALGHSPESWLAMQYSHDLWHAMPHVKLGKVNLQWCRRNGRSSQRAAERRKAAVSEGCQQFH